MAVRDPHKSVSFRDIDLRPGGVTPFFDCPGADPPSSTPPRTPLVRTMRCVIAWLLGATALMGGCPHISGAETAEPAAKLTLMRAVEATLLLQPDILLEKETVRLSEGILQEQHGVFDPVVSAAGGKRRVDTPLPAGSQGAHQTTDTLSFASSVEKKLRNGLVLKPSLSLNRMKDPLLYATDQNYAAVSLNLLVPLLHGSGEAAVAGPEKAAAKGHEASLRQLRHVMATLVLDTVTSYWVYASTAAQAQEFRNSELRAREYVRMVNALVVGDEMPGSELENVTANLEARSAQRIASEYAMREARQKLGLAMGLSGEEIELLPDPTDPTPTDSQEAAKNIQPSQLVLQALKQRDDYRAAQKAVEAAAILLETEKNGCLPDLDLELSLGYAGLEEGAGESRFVGALGGNLAGPSASAMLRYRLPVGNNTAQGRVLQREAAFRQSRITAENLARRIGAAVPLACAAVASTAAEADRIARSVSNYKRALDNALKKVRLGAAGFLDVMVIEDRLRDAIQESASARARHAVARVKLRFETGSLLSGEGERVFVRREDIIALPQETPGRKNP